MTRQSAGLAALALAMAAGHAEAGGLDRSTMNYNILFDSGNEVEFGLNFGRPSVKGTYPAFAPGSTGNMAEPFTALSFGLKKDLSDKLALAFVIGQPVLADAKYPDGLYTGLEAHWSTTEAAALLKYRLGGGVSVFGGLRYVTSSANIVIPSQLFPGNPGNYTASAASNGQFGYLLGVAYEKPEIALRVGLTYASAIKHDFTTVENFVALPANLTTTTDITLPQSVTLDAQTGIAADTLLFGSLRWAEWSKWHVAPAGYKGMTGGEITGFDHDVLTWTLGLGRKINDKLSVFGAFSYERATGDVASRLAPTDGMKSLTLGASWTEDKMKITGGVQYQKLGSAVDSVGTSFKGNSALGLGLQVTYSF